LANTRRRKISRKFAAAASNPDPSPDTLNSEAERPLAPASSKELGPVDDATIAGDSYGGHQSAPNTGKAVATKLGADHRAVEIEETGTEAGAATGQASEEPFQYCIDAVSETQILGWIRHRERPAQRCVVALGEGDRILARTTASQFRADLTWAGIGDGCYAFAFDLPASLFDGVEHALDVIEDDTGFRLTPEPLSWRAERVAIEATLATPTVDGVQDRALAPDFDPFPELRRRDRRTRVWPEETDDQYAGSPAGQGSRTQPRLPASARADTHILFDVSDLIYYIGHHSNLTGIQRVQSSIVLAILRYGLLPVGSLVFLSFNARTRNWMEIPRGFLHALLEDLFLPATQRSVSFPVDEARQGALPGGRDFDGAGVLDDGDSSILCLLGAAWVHQDYLHRLLVLKRRFGTRFVMMVHDLIPIYARETCDQDTARVFEEFMERILPHTDHVLSVSESTAADLLRYTATLQLTAPPITVSRNGSSFAEFLPEDQTDGELRTSELPPRFVLFVATIEGRKNHALMLRIWQHMVKDGDDPPHLVCVGRLGWKSSGFVGALVESDYLDGRVHLLRDVSDTDLRTLYRHCLFTVCPSLYEGWGLPVDESLAMGKICVSSDRASLPEVVGEFGEYIDIDDFAGSLRTIRAMIADDARRERLESTIRHAYKPVTWRAVAERVIEGCRAATNCKWREPYPYTAVPYASEISFSRPDPATDVIGELLLTRIAGARRGVFLADPLDDQAFRRGEEIRDEGNWAVPEDWGTWACGSGGAIALALPPEDSSHYYVFMRLRTIGPLQERTIRISANGELIWDRQLGVYSRDVLLRVRRGMGGGVGHWRLRLKVQTDLTPELRRHIADLDSRIPTIGFERLIVVPEDDLRARVNILSNLVSQRGF
jgi:glycosyltransferase involved in cell wall biosynthesis